jgi:hypothetical protein
VFYLVVAALAVRIATLHGSHGGQADAHGALALVSGSWPGKVGIALASLGLLGFGLARLNGARTDNDEPWWRRATTALQGLFYLGLAYVPVSFLFGDHQAGTEQQQHADAAKMLGLPFGQELVVAVGAVVVITSGWQIRTAITGDYLDGLKLRGASRRMKRLVRVAGAAGIPARALVFGPIGVFLIVAGAEYDPQHADGLDGELLALSHHAWGVFVIACAALGLVVFAGYSFLEARYRDVLAAE